MTILMDKVHFNPDPVVTFQPDTTKQEANIEMTNKADKVVMFKMKSNRPDLFKMRPVYGLIQPGEKKSVRLIYKDLKEGQITRLQDHFTVVLALAPSTTVKVDKMWKQHKYLKKTRQATKWSKYLAVRYESLYLPPSPKITFEKISTKKVAIKKGKGLVEQEQKSVVIPPSNGCGPPVLLIYRSPIPSFDDDSDTDEENDDEEEEDNGEAAIEVEAKE